MRLQLMVFLVVNCIGFTSPEEQREEGYAVQTGHISMNDSEITLLINSTYEIIEDFELYDNIRMRVLLFKQLTKRVWDPTGMFVLQTNNETEEATPTTTAPKKTIRLHKIRRPTPTLNCRKFTDAEKYRLLEDAGGRNQMYMAASVDEAGKNFAEHIPRPSLATSSVLSDTLADAVDVHRKSAARVRTACDERCQMVKTALDAELRRRNHTSENLAGRMYHDAEAVGDGGDGGDNDALQMTHCFLGDFIPVGQCSDLGEVVSGTHESLCSACHGLFMLSSNCFPRFFNAIKCNQQEMACIFDAFSDKAHGQCHMQTLSFKVLRNIGDARCEEWSMQQIELPVSCQCSLSRTSWLRSKPSKEL